jgi:hypothetical protein
MEVPYENRVVAFVDILGFASLVARLPSEPELHKRLHYALSHIKSYKLSSLRKDTAHANLEVSVFSDSVVISGNEDDLYGVVYACGWLQAQLLGQGILVRGGISSGKTMHTDDLLYGEGMLKAYKIESSAAVYPRIVIDPKLVNQSTQWICHILLLKDADGLWHIDPFSLIGTSGDVEALLEDGYDPHDIYLDKLGKYIEEGISTATEVDRLAKWTWIKARYDLANEEYSKTRKTRFWRFFELAQKVKQEGKSSNARD